jgi:hypothetical protein
MTLQQGEVMVKRLNKPFAERQVLDDATTGSAV